MRLIASSIHLLFSHNQVSIALSPVFLLLAACCWIDMSRMAAARTSPIPDLSFLDLGTTGPGRYPTMQELHNFKPGAAPTISASKSAPPTIPEASLAPSSPAERPLLHPNSASQPPNSRPSPLHHHTPPPPPRDPSHPRPGQIIDPNLLQQIQAHPQPPSVEPLRPIRREPPRVTVPLHPDRHSYPEQRTGALARSTSEIQALHRSQPPSQPESGKHAHAHRVLRKAPTRRDTSGSGGSVERPRRREGDEGAAAAAVALRHSLADERPLLHERPIETLQRSHTFASLSPTDERGPAGMHDVGGAGAVSGGSRYGFAPDAPTWVPPNRFGHTREGAASEGTYDPRTQPRQSDEFRRQPPYQANPGYPIDGRPMSDEMRRGARVDGLPRPAYEPQPDPRADGDRRQPTSDEMRRGGERPVYAPEGDVYVSQPESRTRPTSGELRREHRPQSAQRPAYGPGDGYGAPDSHARPPSDEVRRRTQVGVDGVPRQQVPYGFTDSYGPQPDRPPSDERQRGSRPDPSQHPSYGSGSSASTSHSHFPPQAYRAPPLPPSEEYGQWGPEGAPSPVHAAMYASASSLLSPQRAPFDRTTTDEAYDSMAQFQELAGHAPMGGAGAAQPPTIGRSVSHTQGRRAVPNGWETDTYLPDYAAQTQPARPPQRAASVLSPNERSADPWGHQPGQPLPPSRPPQPLPPTLPNGIPADPRFEHTAPPPNQWAPPPGTVRANSQQRGAFTGSPERDRQVQRSARNGPPPAETYARQVYPQYYQPPANGVSPGPPGGAPNGTYPGPNGFAVYRPPQGPSNKPQPYGPGNPAPASYSSRGPPPPAPMGPPGQYSDPRAAAPPRDRLAEFLNEAAATQRRSGRSPGSQYTLPSAQLNHLTGRIEVLDDRVPQPPVCFDCKSAGYSRCQHVNQGGKPVEKGKVADSPLTDKEKRGSGGRHKLFKRHR